MKAIVYISICNLLLGLQWYICQTIEEINTTFQLHTSLWIMICNKINAAQRSCNYRTPQLLLKSQNWDYCLQTVRWQIFSFGGGTQEDSSSRKWHRSTRGSSLTSSSPPGCRPHGIYWLAFSLPHKSLSMALSPVLLASLPQCIIQDLIWCCHCGLVAMGAWMRLMWIQNGDIVDRCF